MPIDPFNLPPTFGRYRIVKKLGVGGMGAVYLAEDTTHRRQVALKVPYFSPQEGAQVRARFQREAKLASSLKIPGICRTHDIGEVSGQPYLTMEFIEGQLLADRIDEQRVIPQPEAANLVRRIALVVQEAHARGVVHRDLKPANVMLRTNGEPVVMDFGLARSEDETLTRLTSTGVVLGTPAYMAPEQARGALNEIGPRTDIYSLGVILYELLAGQRPFDGPPAVVLALLLTRDPTPLSALRVDVHPQLEKICQRAMAKAPGQRFSSMAAFAEALKPFITSSKGLVNTNKPSSPTNRVSPSTPTPQPKPRKPLTLAAAWPMVVVLVLLGAFGGGGLLYSLVGSPAPPPTSSPGKGNPVGGGAAPLLPGIPEKKPLEAVVFVTNSVGMRLARIPPGTFRMGSPQMENGRRADEQARDVQITRPYYLGVFEVTQEEYVRVTSDPNPSWFRKDGEGANTLRDIPDTGQFPVEQVSWEMAREFCRKLSERPEEKSAKRVYRLPTEAEWERACRGGEATPFCFAQSSAGASSTRANFRGDIPYGDAPTGPYLARTERVGSYPPNPFGLYDMHGNVWEWCEDDYGSLVNLQRIDPLRPHTPTGRPVFRGGSYLNDGADCRAARRDQGAPTLRNFNIGFRVAVDIGESVP